MKKRCLPAVVSVAVAVVAGLWLVTTMPAFFSAPDETARESFDYGIETEWGFLRGNPNTGRARARAMCSGCHRVDGVGKALPGTPSLAQVVNRPGMDAGYLRRWLKSPPAIKPGTLMPDFGLSDREIEHYIAFLYSYRQ